MTMTYSQAMEALRNADESGHTEDAGKLAIIADRLRPTANNAPSADIPTDVVAGKPSKVDHDVWDKIASGLSGGKYGSWSDLFHGGEKPDDSYLGELSQIIDATGIQGLTGAGPADIASLSPSLIPAIGKNIPNIAPILAKVKTPFNALGEIAAQGYSRLNPSVSANVIKAPLKIGLENDPATVAAFKKGISHNAKRKLEDEFNQSLASGDKWNEKVVGSMGPGGESVTEAARNFRMQKGLSPSEAATFKASRSGIIVPNTSATNAENISQYVPKFNIDDAYEAGKTLSPWLPARESGAEKMLGLDLLATLASYGHPAIKAAIAGVESPYIAGQTLLNVGRGIHHAGKATKAISPYVNKAVESTKNLTMPQLLGAVGSENEGLKKAKGGMIPMSLRDMHYHRLHRQRQG